MGQSDLLSCFYQILVASLVPSFMTIWQLSRRQELFLQKLSLIAYNFLPQGVPTPPLIRRNGPLLMLSRRSGCTVNTGEISFWRQAFSVNSIKQQSSQAFPGSTFPGYNHQLGGNRRLLPESTLSMFVSMIISW